jgi:hypothetical protein
MSFPDHPVPVIAAFMANVPNNSRMYMWHSGINSGVAGETAVNEVCVCVCARNGKNKQEKQSNRKNCDIVVKTMENQNNAAGNTLQYH